jgi:hypothetical protein
MRPIIAAATIVAAALAFAGGASAQVVPNDGYLIFKANRGMSVTEYRARGTGNLLRNAAHEGGRRTPEECLDDSYVLAGPRWKRDPKYWVNVRTIPRYLNDWKALWDIVAAGDAWDSPFRTNCRTPRGHNSFEIRTAGLTSRHATLVTELESDGKNVVAFEDLEGTVCDGAIACVIIDFEDSKIFEADMALETNIQRITGLEDFWTTSNTTWFDDQGGRWAVSDVVTHEFGHFAGLDNVFESPTLTMYPWIHDGDDTLGLGDMLGMLALY